MKILILGGNGFVGCNLAAHLSEFYTVQTASRKVSSTNLYFDIHQPNSYSVCDNYDVIINCIVDYSNTIADTINKELAYKMNFLKYVGNLNCHFIEISSIFSLPENKYIADYNFSKLLLEEVFYYTTLNSKSEFSLLRFAQIIHENGQSRKTQGGFHYFVDCFKNKTTLNVFGNPTVPRSYMPISILVQTVHSCIKEKILGTHNVIMPDIYSANDLITTFKKYISKSDSEFNYDPSRFAFEYFIPPCSKSFVTLLADLSCEPTFKNCLLNNEV